MILSVFFQASLNPGTWVIEASLSRSNDSDNSRFMQRGLLFWKVNGSTYLWLQITIFTYGGFLISSTLQIRQVIIVMVPRSSVLRESCIRIVPFTTFP